MCRSTPAASRRSGSPSIRVTSTVSQTFSDRAGNTTTATAGILPLTVDASASPAPTAAGWNNTDVVVTITASGDSVGTHRITYQLTGAENRGATVTACSFRSCEVDSITLTIKTEGITTLSYSAMDAAGNSTATRSLGIKIDKTAPDVSYTLDPPGGSSTDPVTVTFTASDSLSGLTGVAVDSSGVATVRVTVDPRLTSSVSQTFTDRAGNAPVVTADVLPARGCVLGTTRRASVASTGAQAHGASTDPAISADGRFVAFASAATNLVPGDTNGVADIFVHDRQTGAVERVSVSSAGAQANGGSSRPVISQHGVLVVFESDATNLVLGDTNGKRDIFVHDRLTHSTTRVSVNSDGTQRIAFGSPRSPSSGSRSADRRSTGRGASSRSPDRRRLQMTTRTSSFTTASRTRRPSPRWRKAEGCCAARTPRSAATPPPTTPGTSRRQRRSPSASTRPRPRP